MQEPEWLLLVAAPSALGRAPARSQPLPPAGPILLAVHQEFGESAACPYIHEHWRTKSVYSRDPSTRPRGGRGAGPAVRSSSPHVHEGYEQQAAVSPREGVSWKEGRQESLGDEWKGSSQGIRVT